MSPFAVLTVLMRRWKLVFGTPLVLAGLVLLASTLRPPRYVAQSRFAPQDQPVSSAAFAGVAAQLGIPFSAGGSSESVQFYATLVTSRDLLEPLARTRFHLHFPVNGKTDGTLMDLLRIGGANEDARLQTAGTVLKGNIVASVDTRANMVVLATTAPSGELAVAINKTLLDLVNDFNITRRKSAAAAERKFVEERVQSARDELRQSEAALMVFLEHNRRYEGSAVKPFQYGRLERDVELRQTVYASLAQRLEQARVDEVRNTPVITVIESPERSAQPIRHPLRSTATALLLGTLLGLALAFGIDYYELERSRNPEAYGDFDNARPRWLRGLLRGRRRAAQATAHTDVAAVPASAVNTQPG